MSVERRRRETAMSILPQVTANMEDRVTVDSKRSVEG